jgi:hypothetical protein
MIQRNAFYKGLIISILQEVGGELPISVLERTLTHNILKRKDIPLWSDPANVYAYQELRMSKKTFYKYLGELAKEEIVEEFQEYSKSFVRLKENKKSKKYLECLKNYPSEEDDRKKIVSQCIQRYAFYKISSPAKSKELIERYKLLGSGQLGVAAHQAKYFKKLLNHLKTFVGKSSINKFKWDICLILLELDAKGELSNNFQNDRICEKVLKIYEERSRGSVSFSH